MGRLILRNALARTMVPVMSRRITGWKGTLFESSFYSMVGQVEVRLPAVFGQIRHLGRGRGRFNGLLLYSGAYGPDSGRLRLGG